MKVTFLNYWSEISLALGGIVAFIVGRKTKKNEEKSGDLQNIETVREIEKKLVQDMEGHVEKLLETNRVLSELNEALNQYNDTLEDIVDKQAKRIQDFEERYGSLESTKFDINA